MQVFFIFTQSPIPNPHLFKKNINKNELFYFILIIIKINKNNYLFVVIFVIMVESILKFKFLVFSLILKYNIINISKDLKIYI